MHKVYKPGEAPAGYNFEEYCPRCDQYIPVVVDDDEFTGYDQVCPVCGKRLMLCTLCHDDNGDVCDWTEKHGCRYGRRNLNEQACGV